MLQLKDIQARLPRLRQLAEGLAKEIHRWRTEESPLLRLETHFYVKGLHEVLAGLVVAVEVLEKASKRVEALDLPSFLGGGREEETLS